MDTSNDPPAKRIKLDNEATTAPTASTSATAAAAPPAPAPALPASSAHSFDGETGLFGSINSTLGVRASNEDEVGITEYADASIPPFSGIIKHRFTDFLVYEVGLDGQVVRLKDIQGPQRQKKEKPVAPPEAKEGEVKEAAAGGAAEPKELWTPAAEAIMAPLVGTDKLAEFQAFLLAGPPARNVPKGTPRPLFQSSAIEAKEARTAFHKGLREAFNGRLVSEMKELEGGVQVISVSWKMGGGGGEKQQRQSKAERIAAQGGDHPPYIHFTLQKTNKEMHDALSGLCRTLHLQSRDLGTAGTKDKRAVTVQRVTMKRGNKTIEDVWRAAKGGGGGGRGRGRGRGGAGGWSNGPDRGVRIGDVEYGQGMLDLGMLKGNKFVVTLRDVEADTPTTITRAMSTLSSRGFINYYGMQRFGTSPIPTHAIGLALLRSDWALATHLILRPREGEAEDVQLARIVYGEGKIGEAIRLMPRRSVAERAVLEGLQRNPTDHLSALSKIPKNLRMMYVHAWQSYIWNLVVSERVKLHGCTDPVVGDLVLLDGAATGEGEIEADEPAAPAAVESLDPNLDDDLPNSAASGPLSSDRATLISRVAKAKILTQADIDSKAYSVFDVVLPLPGYAVLYPTGPLGERYREIMRSDKIDPDDLFRKQKEYSLGGAYRKIMHLPSDVSHKLLLYSSAAQDLAQSDEDVLLGRPAPEVTLYDPEAGEPIPAGHSLALQLEVTLGSSTYCTMALREVLKVKTSGAHQRLLTEQMEERLKDGEGAAPSKMEVDVESAESAEPAAVAAEPVVEASEIAVE